MEGTGGERPVGKSHDCDGREGVDGHPRGVDGESATLGHRFDAGPQVGGGVGGGRR